MIHVGRLAPVGCWDQHLIELLLSNRLYPTGLEFHSWEGYPGYPHAEGCILQIPGAYWHDHYDTINEALTRYRWVLGMRVSDEEDLFDITKVEHPQLKWWVQTPKMGVDYGDARLFGVGFPPHFDALSKQPPDKTLDVFLAAQNTHVRRFDAFYMLKDFPNSVVEETKGFTQGMEHADYTAAMVGAKVAPAPSGAVSPDSFRLFEALEAHAVPIADDISPTYDSAGFWRQLFNGEPPPFPILEDYRDLPGYVNDCLECWPAKANRVAAWWVREKRSMAIALIADLKALGAL